MSLEEKRKADDGRGLVVTKEEATASCAPAAGTVHVAGVYQHRLQHYFPSWKKLLFMGSVKYIPMQMVKTVHAVCCGVLSLFTAGHECSDLTVCKKRKINSIWVMLESSFLLPTLWLCYYFSLNETQ